MPPLIIAGEALAAGGAAEGAAASGALAETEANAAEMVAATGAREAGAAESRTPRIQRFAERQTRQRFESETRGHSGRASNDNDVSKLVWLFLGIAVLLDLFKVLLLFFSLIPVIGLIITATGSFFISVIEITVVFGGLWALGVYKSPKNGTLFTLLTMGVTAADLVPILDDFPFTSPTVLFMILRAYAERKAGSMLSSAGGEIRTAALAPANDNVSEAEQAA